MRYRSYGELAVLQQRGLGAAEADSAEAIFGKIVGGLADVAKVVVPAVINKGTGSSTVDDLLKRLSAGTAIQPAPAAQPVATTGVGGIPTSYLVLGGFGLLAILLVARR